MDAATQRRTYEAPADKPARKSARTSLIVRRRFQFAGALVLGAVFPWLLRGPVLPGTLTEHASVNTLFGNVIAIIIAFRMRLSIETYPGIRRSYVIFPAALTGHGLMLVSFVLMRLPYDRVALALGFGLNVCWLYVLYFASNRVRRRIAMVPFGTIDRLQDIHAIDWMVLRRPRLQDARGCDAIVADFSADLPDEWEAFLADAALAGRIVYQVKQLWESLSGLTEIEQLSENSFGSLMPMRGYFHLKGVVDFVFAILILPIALPLMAVIAFAIRLDGPGTVLFRQKRVGHAGKHITVYKFRTMRPVVSRTSGARP